MWPRRRIVRRGLLDQRSAKRDLTAGYVGILGHEGGELGLGVDPVQEPARNPPVKAADDRLAFTHGVAIRAVVEAVGERASVVEAASGLEAHRDQYAIDLRLRWATACAAVRARGQSAARSPRRLVRACRRPRSPVPATARGRRTRSAGRRRAARPG